MTGHLLFNNNQRNKMAAREEIQRLTIVLMKTRILMEKLEYLGDANATIRTCYTYGQNGVALQQEF